MIYEKKMNIISIRAVLVLCYLSTVQCQNNLTIISTNNQVINRLKFKYSDY